MKLAPAAFALIALAACGAAGPAPGEPPSQAAVVAEPTGASQALAAETDDGVQMMAAVIRVDDLRNQPEVDAKLFGVGGGDPAMNGLNTYIAFFLTPADGWATYRVGDFLDYRIVAESEGRVELEITESVMDDASGQISSRKRPVMLTWPRPEPGMPPARVTRQD